MPPVTVPGLALSQFWSNAAATLIIRLAEILENTYIHKLSTCAVHKRKLTNFTPDKL